MGIAGHLPILHASPEVLGGLSAIRKLPVGHPHHEPETVSVEKPVGKILRIDTEMDLQRRKSSTAHARLKTIFLRHCTSS